MKKIIIGLTILASMSNLAMDNTEEKLFGEYPAKYFCIKKRFNIVKCMMPTLEQMDEEISIYNETIEDRQRKLEDYYNKINPRKEEILKIADDWYSEIGDNTFSQLYTEYAEKLDEMRRSDLPKEINVEEEIGENGKYINFLKQVRTAIADGITDLEFGELVLSHDANKVVNNYHKLLNKLDADVNYYNNKAYKWDFSSLIPLPSSCSKLKGYGKYQFKKVQIHSFELQSYKTFDIVKDQSLLKELLSSNNGMPIKLNCHKVKKNSKMDLSYNKEKKTLNIPYKIVRGFGSIPDSIGVGFKKSIVIPENGYFTEELKEVLNK